MFSDYRIAACDELQSLLWFYEDSSKEIYMQQWTAQCHNTNVQN